MDEWTTLRSQEDASVNFVRTASDQGKIECRFVQRHPGYFIVYLSSHTGCNQSCRFCHLTQSKQTMMRDASFLDYLVQAETVLDYWDEEHRPYLDAMPSNVHFNWMARGEPLLNREFVQKAETLINSLTHKADVRGLSPKFNVSTIMPREFNSTLLTKFDGLPLTFFYSLYSLNPEFRRRWLPKAMNPVDAISQLAQYQRISGNDVVLHHALIQGENDSVEDAKRIGQLVEAAGLKTRFNLVLYNPYAPHLGHEPDSETVMAYFQTLEPYMGVPGSRVVPRVGFDVKASCGMFVEQIP